MLVREGEAFHSRDVFELIYGTLTPTFHDIILYAYVYANIYIRIFCKFSLSFRDWMERPLWSVFLSGPEWSAAKSGISSQPFWFVSLQTVTGGASFHVSVMLVVGEST